ALGDRRFIKDERGAEPRPYAGTFREGRAGLLEEKAQVIDSGQNLKCGRYCPTGIGIGDKGLAGSSGAANLAKLGDIGGYVTAGLGRKAFDALAARHFDAL